MNAFAHMASFLECPSNSTISKQEYAVFCKEYIFDQIRGKRFGRAFCERFNIQDNVVKCLFDEDIAREMILEIYIK